MRVGWMWTNDASVVPPTGQRPRASRYRGRYRVTDVIRLLLVGVIGG